MPFEYREGEEWKQIDETTLARRAGSLDLDAAELRLNLVKSPGKAITLHASGARSQSYRYVEAEG